ncbi:MAG: response regulator [Nitrospirales bacterium]|nr:response regulator [Nitrospirales bacterium]
MKHILVVDDEPIVRRVICLILKQQGHDCVDVRNGHEAMAALKANPPVDLVITDNRMPMMNGLQLIAYLKTSPAYRHLPIVLLSGYLSEEVKALAIAKDVSAFLSKPLDVGELTETVNMVLKAGQSGLKNRSGGLISFTGQTIIDQRHAVALAASRQQSGM